MALSVRHIRLQPFLSNYLVEFMKLEIKVIPLHLLKNPRPQPFLIKYIVEFHETWNKYEPTYWDDARPIFFWIGQFSLELFPLIY